MAFEDAMRAKIQHGAGGTRSEPCASAGAPHVGKLRPPTAPFWPRARIHLPQVHSLALLPRRRAAGALLEPSVRAVCRKEPEARWTKGGFGGFLPIPNRKVLRGDRGQAFQN